MRMKKMKFFDPACGSGNFLIITYKELRSLEMKILKLMQKMMPDYNLQFVDGSIININQFYGLEINDFACETAVLSLWLAEHQMNNQFTKDFGVNIKALPLKTNHNIHCGNACRVEWNEVCPHTEDEEVFVMGNPPYLGSSLQEKSHKEDMKMVFIGKDNWKALDYISCWFYLGTLYIRGSRAKLAFVSTNSISQGEQVSLIWPMIFQNDVSISFGYESFKWSNNAKGNAGVTCTIIGLVNNQDCKQSWLYKANGTIITLRELSPYLFEFNSSTIVKKISTPLNVVQIMNKGSQPTDDGNLTLDAFEKREMIEGDNRVIPFIKPFIGSEEFIKRKERYCIWVEDKDVEVAQSIPSLQTRFENVRKSRLASKKAATRLDASTPYFFTERRYKESPCIVIPETSSESRYYIPIGYLKEGTVVSNAAFVVYDAPEWLFGILTSAMHMTWVRAIGGRLETRYRYSAGLCYNPFPFPKLTEEKKKEIEDAAMEIEGWREYFRGKTLAWLYDPKTMPQELREAHHHLDLIVDSCYRERPFKDENERLEWLLKLYEKMKG